MRNRVKRHLLKLQDVIQIVARYTRSDEETAVVVADLLNRGLVRLRNDGHTYRIVVR